MISLPLDDAYLEWLYAQVGPVREKRSSKTYWNLLRLLYTKEFIWLIPNDDNRVEDGRELRHEFVNSLNLHHIDREWMSLGCSFLEMLIALSGRFAFEAGGDRAYWFWHFLRVLDLDIYTDNMQLPLEKIDDTLDTVIWRTYRSDGHGGLFPLKHPHEDQTEVELWYQLGAYLLEAEF